MMGDKTCTRCLETKSLEEFRVAVGYKDGRQTICKTCINAYTRWWHSNHRAYLRGQRQKRYRANRLNKYLPEWYVPALELLYPDLTI